MRHSPEKPVDPHSNENPAALWRLWHSTRYLGCGAVGGDSAFDNVGPMNLLNIRKVGYGARSIDECVLRVAGAGKACAPARDSGSASQHS